jgi:hypothetical protein
MTPPYGLRADGPLMTGGCVGAGSGAGIRLSKAGVDDGDAPNSVVGLCAKPPRPTACPNPPRAKPGVEPTIQAAAKITAKRRFMVAPPILGLRASISAIHLGNGLFLVSRAHGQQCWADALFELSAAAVYCLHAQSYASRRRPERRRHSFDCRDAALGARAWACARRRRQRGSRGSGHAAQRRQRA